MIATQTKALIEGKLEIKIKTYTIPHLLFIEEIGYPPIDQTGAILFFHPISRLY